MKIAIVSAHRLRTQTLPWSRIVEQLFGPEYGELIARAGEARRRARAASRTATERIEAGERVARLALAGREPV